METDAVQGVTEPHCEICRFWHPGGLCMRHAPLAGPDGMWPIVGIADWCGDYEPTALERSRLAYERMEQVLAQAEETSDASGDPPPEPPPITKAPI